MDYTDLIATILAGVLMGALIIVGAILLLKYGLKQAKLAMQVSELQIKYLKKQLEEDK